MMLFVFSPTLGEDDPEGSESLSGSGPKYYKRVDEGKSIKDVVTHNGEGHFISLIQLNGKSADTLKTYVQGVVKGKIKPNYKKANRADLVIWCYPDTYRHPRHMFSEASGRIFINIASEDMLIVVTESYIEDHKSLNLDETRNRFVLSP